MFVCGPGSGWAFPARFRTAGRRNGCAVFSRSADAGACGFSASGAAGLCSRSGPRRAYEHLLPRIRRGHGEAVPEGIARGTKEWFPSVCASSERSRSRLSTAQPQGGHGGTHPPGGDGAGMAPAREPLNFLEPSVR